MTLLINQGSEASPHAVNDLSQSATNLALMSTIEMLINTYSPVETRTESEKANFAVTPVRAFKAWQTVFSLSACLGEEREAFVQKIVKHVWPSYKSRAEILQCVASVLSTNFPMENLHEDTGIVTQGPVQARGVCPHHLLPVEYEVFVSYKPIASSVLGLSKLARIVELLVERPVLQEQATMDIADALFYTDMVKTDVPQIPSGGSAVQLIGRHACMECRGVKSGALTLTTILRGAFTDESLKAEFYQGIESIRNAQPKNFNLPYPKL